MGDKRKWMAITGFLLVLMAVIAGLGYGYAFVRLYKANDAVATFHAIQSDIKLYNLFVWSFVLVALLDFVVAGTLYGVFKEVHTKLASTMSWLRILYAILFMDAIVHLFSVSCRMEETLPAATVVMLHLEKFLSVWSFALIVFGVHLVLLALVVYRSKFIPKAIGVLTMFAGICYFFTNCANRLVPEYVSYKNTVDAVLTLPMALGELLLAFWLIYWGFKKSNKSN